MTQHVRASIVAADDQAGTRQLLEVILGAYYDVVTVVDGLALLEYVKDHTPDLVILDVSMPGLDGLEVCSRLRRVNRFTNTAIIILTAEVGDRTRDGAKLFGADLFIEKPLLARPLLKQVRDLLEVFSRRTGI